MRQSLCFLAFACVAFAADGYVKHRFHKEQLRSLSKRQIAPGDLDANVTENTDLTLYWLDLSIGTPPQSFRQQLDTGSSNLWVPDATIPKCASEGQCPGGGFDSSSSSTYQTVLPDAFNISYLDGTGANGDFFTDVVTVGKTSIPAGIMSIGIARSLVDGPKLVNDGQGLVGVGYAANIAGLEELSSDTYTPVTVVGAMVQAGDINRESYSLYLNDPRNSVGEIIFGGVDPTKYKGDLVAFQVLPMADGSYEDFNIVLTGISAQINGSDTTPLTQPDFAVPALMDSGNSLTDLPAPVFNELRTGLGISEDGYIQCEFAGADASITYTFGGGGENSVSVSVPINNLVAPWDGKAQFENGSPACSFGIDSKEDGTATLGDTFMRNAYLFYDLENNQIAVAQGVLNVTEEAITAVPSGTEIPGCTKTNTMTLVAAPTETEDEGPGSATTSSAGGAPASPTFDLGSGTASASSAVATGNDAGKLADRLNEVGCMMAACLFLLLSGL